MILRVVYYADLAVRPFCWTLSYHRLPRRANTGADMAQSSRVSENLIPGLRGAEVPYGALPQ